MLAREALEALGPVKPDAVIGSLMREDSNDAGRAAAAETLGSAGEPAIEPLRKLLRDPAACVRRAALAGLARIPVQAALDEGRAALDDEDGSVRTAALALLAGLSRTLGAASVPLLARRLDDRDLLVRVAAARALGTLGDPAAVEPLLAHSPGASPLMDLALAEALGAFPGHAPARARLADYARSANPDVAALAKRLLG